LNTTLLTITRLTQNTILAKNYVIDKKINDINISKGIVFDFVCFKVSIGLVIAEQYIAQTLNRIIAFDHCWILQLFFRLQFYATTHTLHTV